jgi:hypothetical protein
VIVLDNPWVLVVLSVGCLSKIQLYQLNYNTKVGCEAEMIDQAVPER